MVEGLVGKPDTNVTNNQKIEEVFKWHSIYATAIS